MRYFIRSVILILAAGAALAQQPAQESIVVNVEVPVRVFRGNRFVGDLTINDFELLENGKPQTLEAVYLIKKQAIERRDEIRPFAPQTNRHFYLIFEISDYTPKMGEALDYFLQDVLMPGDGLTIVSPLKTYRLKPRAFEIRSRAEIGGQVKSILRRDALLGSVEYRSVVSELESLSKALGTAITRELAARLAIFAESALDVVENSQIVQFPLDEMFNRYAETLAALDHLRNIDQQQLLNFSKILKGEAGQKYVYLFYQREFVPKIDPHIIDQYIDLFQDRPIIYQSAQSIFQFYRREIAFDAELVKKAYADSSVAIHFLLISEPKKITPGIFYEEQTEDIFGVFNEMARATGGFTESSSNPVFLIKKAVEASEFYYLLYYTPRPYVKDGKFREIQVRVKDRTDRVIHRLGYIAD